MNCQRQSDEVFTQMEYQMHIHRGSNSDIDSCLGSVKNETLHLFFILIRIDFGLNNAVQFNVHSVSCDCLAEIWAAFSNKVSQ